MPSNPRGVDGHHAGGGARKKTTTYLDIDKVSDKASKLMTSIDDYLNALPDEDEVVDEIFKEKFVDLRTWLYAPEYMGLEIQLSPIQFEVMQAMDNYDPTTNPYTEAVCEWGKGSGKDFVSALCALRCVYWLLCLRSPYLYYKLAKGTGIQLCNVAYTAEQSIYVYFKQLTGLIKASSWFVKQKPDIKKSRIDFANEITLVSTSTDGDSAEGQNLIFAVMDEASAFKDSKTIKAQSRKDGVKVDRAADGIYKVLRSSINSRFPNSGKLMIISYPRYKDDYIQTKLEENKNATKGFISGPYATWEVNPSKQRSDFNEDYEKNPELADAMYGCNPPFSEDAWVKYPDRFLKCILNSVKLNTLKSPINEYGIYDPFFQGTPGKLYCIHVDLALNSDKCALSLASQGHPIIKEKCPCGANAPWDEKYEVCSSCGLTKDKWLKISMPTMVVSLLKHFRPRSSASGRQEVHFADIREEILFLRDRGHKIWALSYDGWQSRDSIQTMQRLLGKRIIKDRWGQPIREEEIAQTLSVDRDTKAYDTLKEFIYDERFFITPPEDVKKKEDWETSEDPVAIAFREFRGLRLINAKKVDHAIGSSKDFTDAIAGCAYWISQMPISRGRGPSLNGWRENISTDRR
jgi:hypothetical protein